MERSTSSQSADQDLQDPPDLLGLVRSAWQDSLNFDPEDDDIGFFDSGGDSHLLFVLVERLSELSGMKFKTMDVMKADTIRGHAELLARMKRAQQGEPADGS